MSLTDSKFPRRKTPLLRKLEKKRDDLKKWLELSLVPKNEVEDHKRQIENTEKEIEKEILRISSSKENNEMEDRRSAGGKVKQSQSHMRTDLDVHEGNEMTDVHESSEQGGEDCTQVVNEDVEDETHVTDADPFSDQNRWKRGIGSRDIESSQW